MMHMKYDEYNLNFDTIDTSKQNEEFENLFVLPKVHLPLAFMVRLDVPSQRDYDGNFNCNR